MKTREFLKKLNVLSIPAIRVLFWILFFYSMWNRNTDMMVLSLLVIIHITVYHNENRLERIEKRLGSSDVEA